MLESQILKLVDTNDLLTAKQNKRFQRAYQYTILPYLNLQQDLYRHNSVIALEVQVVQ